MHKTVHSVAETGFSGFLHQNFPWIFVGLVFGSSLDDVRGGWPLAVWILFLGVWMWASVRFAFWRRIAAGLSGTVFVPKSRVVPTVAGLDLIAMLLVLSAGFVGLLVVAWAGREVGGAVFTPLAIVVMLVALRGSLVEEGQNIVISGEADEASGDSA